jgi:C1A family cysteine protease
MNSNFALGAIKSLFDPRDWNIRKVFSLIKKHLPDSLTPTPEALDYRPQLLPIRNQGSLGTCVAMSVSAMKEYQEKKDSKLNEYLSPLYVYSMRMNKPNSGMYPRDALGILRVNGIAMEKDYKYELQNPDGIVPADLISKARQYAIRSYATVKCVEDLKQALVQFGPCMGTINVYNYGSQPWLQNSPPTPSYGGHAMAIVGYTKDSFIIRNSWGDSWGDKGYTYMPFTDFKFFKEVWSAMDESSAGLFKNYKSLWRLLLEWLWANKIRMF